MYHIYLYNEILSHLLYKYINVIIYMYPGNLLPSLRGQKRRKGARNDVILQKSAQNQRKNYPKRHVYFFGCRRFSRYDIYICIYLQTHLSLSSDPSKKGAPTGFTIPIRLFFLETTHVTFQVQKHLCNKRTSLLPPLVTNSLESCVRPTGLW